MNTAFFLPRALCATALLLLLAACGGGGGGTPVAQNGDPATPAAPAPAPAASAPHMDCAP